jgi:flagellar secretion chaperone FliS
MAMGNPYDQYKQQGVMTAHPVKLIVMLYEGCIKQLRLARLAIEKKDSESANAGFQKAQQIILELTMSLDLGYPIAKDLMNLYDFMSREIIEANLTKDAAKVEPLIDMLSILKDAWVQVQKMNPSCVSIAED